MSMEDEPMFKHRRLYGSAFASGKLNIRSDSFVPQSRPTRRTLIALFAAFLIAFSGTQVSQAAYIEPGTYDDDVVFSSNDRIWYDDTSQPGNYIFNGNATIQTTNDYAYPITVLDNAGIHVTVANDKTLFLNSAYESVLYLKYGATMTIEGGLLDVRTMSPADVDHGIILLSGSSLHIDNQAITIQGCKDGFMLDPFTSSRPQGGYLSVTTGALNIKDVYRGIYTENINGMMSHNYIDITADTVDISSTQIGGATGDHPAAIYGMGDNDKNVDADTVTIKAQKYVHLDSVRNGVEHYGRNVLEIDAPELSIKGGNYGLLIYGENEIRLEGEYISITGTDNYGIYGTDYNGFSGNIFDFDADTDLSINGGTFGGRFADGNSVTFSAGNSLTLSGGDYGGYFSGGNSVKLSAGNSLLLSGGSYGIAYLGNDGGERETPKIYAPFVSFTGTNTYGLYVKDADMFVRGSETERATQITSTGGRYGVRAFDDASAELYAEKISISGGECGVMADGSDGNGGSISLSAPVVTVSAGEGGSSIYTDENGSVTAGDKGALVQLTGYVQSGYANDDGTMDKSSGGTAELNLDAADSFLEGQTYDVDWDSNARDVKGITMNLGSGAYWSFSGESTMRFLNGGGGEVLMQNGTVGDKANIGSLSGKGSFLLDTDIAADTADSVFAKTGSGAEYGVLVENSGSDPNRERMNQYLVKTEDKGGTFSLLNRDGKVEAGIYSYSLASEEVEDGKEWYLMRSDLMPEPEPDPEPTPGTDPDEPGPAPDPGTEPDEPAPTPDAPITTDELSSTARAALGSIVSPFIWYIEVDSLYKRIDEYTPDYEGGAWFRAFGKKEYYDNGLVDGVKQEYGGMSAGYDWVKAYDDGAKLYYGFMLGYGDGEREISFGSNDFDSKHFSLYGIYKKPNKFYVAGILKYNRYGSDFDLTESAYRRVEGDFDQNGYGASVQVGREFSLGNGWFWEPQLQFSVLRIEGDSYRTSGSPNAIIDVDMGDTDSVRLRGGLVLGREIINDDGSKFRGYVKASIQHEFDEKTDIWLDRRLFVSDLSGTWGSYGLGLQYRAKHGQSLFFDFEYGCGEKREQPWAVQLGYRIEM